MAFVLALPRIFVTRYQSLPPPEGAPSFGLPTGCCILSDAAQCSELEFLLSLQELARTRTQHN